jgi:hypothetical protein
MNFKTGIGIWLLFLIVGAMSLGRSAQPPQPSQPPQPKKPLSAVEECVLQLGIIDRSIGALDRFAICENPNRSFEAWQAYKAMKR